MIAFRNSVCREIVELDAKNSVNIKIIEGLIKGTKAISLKSIENNTTRINVEWGHPGKWAFWNL